MPILVYLLAACLLLSISFNIKKIVVSQGSQSSNNSLIGNVTACVCQQCGLHEKLVC